jgi:hypothetical protein
LEVEPCCSVQTIAEFFKIPASTVHLRLTASFHTKIRHFKWVPHFLNNDLRPKRLEGIRQLLGVFSAQERRHFRGLITGDDTWVCLDMKPGIVWLPAGAELPIRVKRTIASEKGMLSVFWVIHGIAHYCWLPKEGKLNSPFFWDELLSPLAQKMQPNSKKLVNP